MKVPFFDLRVKNNQKRKELINSLNKMMDHGKFFLGPEVKEFEDKIKKELGMRYAVGVSSGSSALYLALKSLGVKKGDEVITTPLTWVITVNAIAACGAKPIFADVKDDFNINPVSIEKKITNKTKVIIPMHYAGHMCDMKSISKISKKNNIHIVEDAAQAFGASIDGKKACTFSTAASLSMNPMKVLGGYGEAGLVVTNKKKIYNKLKLLRHAGTTSDPQKKITNNCLEISLNHKMDTINAGLLLVSLKNFKKKYDKLKKISAIYDRELKPYVKIQKALPKERHGRYVYPIQTNNRDKLRKFLFKRGIETKIFHEPLVCDAPIYRQKNKTHVPNARKVLKRSLIIPCHDKLTKSQINHVIKAFKSFYK